MMEASLKNIEDYLFTSSVGVYAQKEILKEKMFGKLFLLRMIDLLVGPKEFVNYKHNVTK